MLHFSRYAETRKSRPSAKMLVRSRRYELVESLAKDVAIGT